MIRLPIAGIALAALVAMSGGLALETAAVATVSDKDAAVAPAKKPKKPTVKVAATPLGDILVTTKGRTLYAFDPDGTETVSPKCIDACAAAWPAYVAPKKVKAGKGLDQSLIGIGGGGQVVYNDHFLYQFASDTAAGDTNGQGIGGVWHVVGADGNPIT